MPKNYLRARGLDLSSWGGGVIFTLKGAWSGPGEPGGKIDLEWRDGVFVPMVRPVGLDKLAAEQKANDVFLRLLKRFNSAGRNASDRSGTSYAPALFAQQPDGDRITKNEFKAAMDRLFAANKIRVEVTGPKSRPNRTLVQIDE